ncbi:MAG: AAA family ATPase [archaeon]
MIIKSVKLKNIRSYLDHTIEFPQGSVLLSGDVGSGKSTILLAIDFALFGLRKGSLTGTSLLRNGRDFGFVQLDFSIDDRDVTIKRTLKRTNSSVAQDSGFIMVNGIRKEGTALELKQAILDLLHYPQELLTKSKSLIFRYTIYTPQEEMKQILVGDAEVRLDTLRRVFGIDKYKRVKENSKFFSLRLREKMKEFAGMIADLEEKRAELGTNEEKLAAIKGQVDVLLPKISAVKSSVVKKREDLKLVESEVKAFDGLKKDLEFAEFDYKTKSKQFSDLNEELVAINTDILRLKEEVKGDFDVDLINREIKLKQDVVISFEQELQSVGNDIAASRAKLDSSNFIKASISKLDVCPTCKQKVSDEHKRSISEVESSNIKNLSQIIVNLSDKKALKEKELDDLKKALDSMRSDASKAELFALKKTHVIEKELKKAKVSEQIDALKYALHNLTSLKSSLSEKIAKFADVEVRFEKVRDDLDVLLDQQHNLEVEKASLEVEIKNYNEVIANLSSVIQEKSRIKESLVNLSGIHDWLDEHFINLMDVIEKNIMLRVHADFDAFFQKWFEMIIDNEALKVKLDTDFSPIIIQDGHEMDYVFLSGGEKTAAALAYRLALNQVINNLMSDIRTRDLIILDEPTDGFSSEQLDRINPVLDELNVKQIIIVSHEAKIESFVDNVIRLQKVDHVSGLV